MSISDEIYNINGYNILLLKSNIDNITIKSFIDTGYINEDEDNLGINHLIEHVLVNSNKLCDKDCITDMNKNGITMNAYTGLNIINYFTSGIKSDLEKMVTFIIETTINYDNINDKIIEKEKKAIINELLQNYNNSLINIYNIFNDKIYNYYGLNNFFNYKKQIKNLDNLNEEKLKNFYLKYYNKILFVISGNFNKHLVLDLFRNLLKNDKINDYEHENKIGHCFKFIKGAYYLHDEKIKNTSIMVGFPSIIENSIKNTILLDISIKYIKDISMDILRAKENLIYSLDIISSMNYCGTLVQVSINTINEYSKKTLDIFGKIIKDSFKSINEEFVKGIKKKLIFSVNKQNSEEELTFYENIYINNLFNKCNDKIITFKEYINYYLNIDSSDIKKILQKIFDFDKMVIVYTSQKSII